MNVKLTRGIAAAAVSAAMMLGAAVPALAADAPKTLPNDNGDYYLTKTYDGVSDGTVSETLGFTVTKYKVTDAKSDVTVENMPAVSIAEVPATSGQANKVKLTLSPYTSAGYYYYKVTENKGNSAGVSYNTDPYYLKVTVSYDNGVAKVDSVSLWDTDPTVNTPSEEHKVPGFANTYKSGTLEVKKDIAGNLAQDDEEFTIKVTFTSTNPVRSVVAYTVNGEKKTIAANAWTKSDDGTYATSADITVKGGSTVDFSNVPDGVKYAVKETNSGDGYTPTYEGEAGTLNANETKGDADATATVTNTKKSKVDTGVLLNNAPYIAILGGAAVVTIYVVNKRRHSDMD